MSVLPSPLLGISFSHPPHSFFLSLTFSHSFIPEVTGRGRRECQMHTWFIFMKRRWERRTQRAKQTKESEIVLEVVLCIIGLFIQFLLHKCVCACVCVSVSLLVCASLHLLMCPLSCMHTQYMHNMSFCGRFAAVWAHKTAYIRF